MNLEFIDFIIGVGGIAIGIGVSYLFYRVGLVRKEPKWGIKGNNIISDFGSEWSKLQITYGQRMVKNLTVCKVVFWNSGRATIIKEDLTELDPLRICLQTGDELLDAQILTQNNLASRCAINPKYEDGIVNLSFDYLDRNNGLVIQIVHNGISPTGLTLRGAIRGVEKVDFIELSDQPSIILVGNTNPDREREIRRRMKWPYRLLFVLNILLVFGTLAITSFFLYLSELGSSRIWYILGIWVLGIMLLFLVYSPSQIWNAPPRELQKFLE